MDIIKSKEDKFNNIKNKINNEIKILNSKTCCFTGHRKIEMDENELQCKLANLIFKAIDNGYTHFICGGAIGFDMLAAEQLIFMKTELFYDVTLEIAIPFPKQDKFYNQIDKERYAFVLHNADKITTICNNYNKFSYQLRNKYMVNNSSLVIAYYIGTPSGTKNTIDYAKNQNKKIWPL